MQSQLADARARPQTCGSSWRRLIRTPFYRRWPRNTPTIDRAVLQETAKLHADDAENLELWREFLPGVWRIFDKIYQRIDVSFDQHWGRVFITILWHRLVESFREGLASPGSDGAVCVFLPVSIRR